jgi:hypothetical protein
VSEVGRKSAARFRRGIRNSLLNLFTVIGKSTGAGRVELPYVARCKSIIAAHRMSKGAGRCRFVSRAAREAWRIWVILPHGEQLGRGFSSPLGFCLFSPHKA